jgi:Mrp family chromosome partitioning ATPase
MKQGALISASNLQSLPSIQTLVQREAAARADLSELSFRFKSSSPNVQHAKAVLAEATSLLTDEVSRSVSVMQASLATAVRRESDLSRRLHDLQGQATNRAEVDAGFRRLQSRERTINEQLLLLDRSKYRATAVRDLQSVPASLVMPAEPVATSVVSRIAVTLLGATAAGLIAGIGAALLIERGKQGFRSSIELQTVSDVRCIGMVPDLPRRTRQTDRTSFQVAARNEAVRSVGAEIGLFGVSRECRVILVTSSLYDEGADTLCDALGEVLAAAGKRVMLIGGWLNEAADRGIPPVSKDDFADSSQISIARPNLERRNYYDMDVFRNERLVEVLDAARADFDVVLVESPPVMLTADALVLGRLADTAIHVVRWGETKRHTVLTALQRLKDNSIDVDGVILMGVDLNRHARLGFVDECSYYGAHLPALRQIPSQNATDLR